MRYLKKTIAFPLVAVVLFLKYLRVFSAISIRLAKITGKSNYEIHPKHLTGKPKWFESYLTKSDYTLDLGTNDGTNSIIAAKISKHVVAVDKNAKYLELAKSRATREGLINVDYQKINLEEKLPFANNAFDAVLLLDVLEHIVNEASTLKEVYRVLRKGGRLFLSLPNRQTSWKRFQRFVGVNYFTDPDHKREYTEAEIEQLLISNRFVVKDRSLVTFDTPLAPLIDLTGGISMHVYLFLQYLRKKLLDFFPTETIGYQFVALKK